MQSDSQVLILGGGIAGLAAALSLSHLSIRSAIVEQSAQLGGFAAQYTCKATEACVKCGACIVSEKIRQVTEDPRIEVFTDSRIGRVDNSDQFQATIEKTSSTGETREIHCEVRAVIIATGFHPFDPQRMHYGYKKFPNVVTNLDLERMMRRCSVPERPSDGRTPDRMAFVQCVGSRDAKLGHLWCSKVCCASALRMARLIKMRRPETAMTFFYIDVQTFGKTFQQFYDDAKNEIVMTRAIPGDVYRTPEDRLKVVYYDADAAESREELFDMLVLSVGITSSINSTGLAAMFDLTADESGFIAPVSSGSGGGVFTAGAVRGPMSIAESIASADRAALAAAVFLGTAVNGQQ
jgi:heterodisulfide reductase subunit A